MGSGSGYGVVFKGGTPRAWVPMQASRELEPKRKDNGAEIKYSVHHTGEPGLSTRAKTPRFLMANIRVQHT